MSIAVTLNGRSIAAQPGQILLDFGNFHFPDEQNVNNVTIAALDPVAKIPEYKVCAVRIEKHAA
ncbi:MAG: hypothetical protein HYY78_14080 [Betaproteobacteria bacterium]|nr:hypothetical protein [Betaproteobacteria bacterium]